MTRLYFAAALVSLAASVSACGGETGTSRPEALDQSRLEHVAETCRVQDYFEGAWDGTKLELIDSADYWVCVYMSLGIDDGALIDASNSRAQTRSFTMNGLTVDWARGQAPYESLGDTVIITDPEGLTWDEHQAKYGD